MLDNLFFLSMYSIWRQSRIQKMMEIGSKKRVDEALAITAGRLLAKCAEYGAHAPLTLSLQARESRRSAGSLLRECGHWRHVA